MSLQKKRTRHYGAHAYAYGRDGDGAHIGWNVQLPSQVPQLTAVFGKKSWRHWH